MRVLAYTAAGGADVIALAERPLPPLAERTLCVRVAAAALNRADIMQRTGRYPAPPGWPADVPGLEYAGTVEETGPGVTRWRAGDRVMGLVGGGAMSEYVAVHEAEALAVPAEMPFTDAAAIPEAFLTAWDALVHRGRAQPGERVLIHAAASGVGTAAIQLCHLLGVTSIGTTRSAAKVAALTALGCAEVIDTGTRGFREQLAAPVDVIIDCLGAAAFNDNLDALRPRGRLVLLGFLGGARGEFDLAPMLRKRLEVIGTVMRAREHAERAPLVQEFAERVLPHFGGTAPRLRPIVDRVMPMEALAEAQRAMEANASIGKIVVAW